jgi:8-oxo-dGTP diphosphatase
LGLARFITLHAVPEDKGEPRFAPTRFALMIAGTPAGIALVFNRWRNVWELPGGLVDPGETPRDCAMREFHEETGGEAGEPEWLGLVEVHDGSTQFGAVYRCTARFVPKSFESVETGGLAFWTRGHAPSPLGNTDIALLNRFG